MQQMTRNTASLAALVFLLAPAVSQANDIAAAPQTPASGTLAAKPAALPQPLSGPQG